MAELDSALASSNAPSPNSPAKETRAVAAVVSNPASVAPDAPASSAPAAPATATTGRPMILAALKEEIFELELEHKQGRISQAEYEKAKAALDATLERALKRQAQKA
jgi:hypothetical protein